MNDTAAPLTAIAVARWRVRAGAVATGLAKGLATGLLGITMFAVTLLSAGCGGGGESPVGSWASTEGSETLELRSDGTAILTRADGVAETLTWQADGTSLALGVKGGDTRTFGYSIEADVLTLTYPGEEPAQYTRLESNGG